jgi:hypothetical protein
MRGASCRSSCCSTKRLHTTTNDTSINIHTHMVVTWQLEEVVAAVRVMLSTMARPSSDGRTLRPNLGNMQGACMARALPLRRYCRLTL